MKVLVVSECAGDKPRVLLVEETFEEINRRINAVGATLKFEACFFRFTFSDGRRILVAARSIVAIEEQA